MKRRITSAIYLSLFGLCVLASGMTFTSCGDDDESKDPGFNNTKTFTINSRSYAIRSAGYYFNDVYGNFSIVFSADNQDLSRQLTHAPSAYLKINIPQEKCNMTCDLTQSLNSSYAIFYVQTADGSFADFTEGKIRISVSNNHITAYMRGTAEKGPTLELQYDGSISKSQQEIW